MIRSLNQLHYITSDQSHTVKATQIQPLVNSSGCFLEFVRTVSLKLMSSRTCYDKYICFKLSLILLIIGLNSQQHRHVILNCTKGLYSIKTRLNALSHCCPASPSSQLWAWAVNGAARSRQPWTGEHHRQAKTPEKNAIKRVLSYVR